jgi:Tol biopolymer transport system component
MGVARGWNPMGPGTVPVWLRPAARRSIVTALCCFVAWAAGAAVALLLVGFPTIAMFAFFLVGLPEAALLGLLTERLARFLEPTDVIGRTTRVQAAAMLTLVAFAIPILATRYVPGIRLSPLQDPPGHPTIVFSASGLDGNPEIYLMRGNAKHLTRLTFDPGTDVWPALSPDGSQVAFVSTRAGDVDIYVLPVDDPSSIRQLTDVPKGDYAPAWSPDGTRIAFTSVRSGNRDVWVMDADGGAPHDLTARSPAEEYDPAWSPDGSTIAFVSLRGGTGRLWTVPADGGRPTRLPGDDIRWLTGPQWSKDGTRLCFAMVPAPGTSADIFTIRTDGTGLVRVTSDPSWESYCHWFDHDRYLWLVSDRPDLGFDFAYYVPSSGGQMTLFARG